MEHYTIILITACLFGFIMSWGIGANDVANVMGTSVGSKAITLKQAIIIAALFEFAGAFLAGGQVTDTIRSKIIDTQALELSRNTLIFGMMASLLAAGLWLSFASHFGWPVSTTHSIIGAILGFGLLTLGAQHVYWDKVFSIVLSWFVTPIIAGLLANLIFHSIHFLILNTEKPLDRAKRLLPGYVFLVACTVSLVTLTKGLQHVGLALTPASITLITGGFACLLSLFSSYLLAKVKHSNSKEAKYDYQSVERAFAKLMILTACAMAFAHGSNDVANAIGPLSAVVDAIQTEGVIRNDYTIPNWILLLGASGIVLGLLTYGYRVIQTIGVKITELTPTRGFAAEFATASTVLFASGLGLPVSTTQTLVGAIIGIGLAKGFGALNLKVVRNIVISWLVTLPTGALLTVSIFFLLQRIF